ncbi:hypothetical protein HXX76_016215 [Chlamydomonas incerta]|uniref:Uncharacterized protein n=1 Tax=Chlamydomonas incerta TaxID=51695 RepID=A0A835SGS8_CHLIN|nr:hypothetical protein HXX76_016215 [Chlamydomonas incerta]|eukprot:KAG2422194.1 hypothetical protein HXX76_016215 [Chlamydomonas incerta]
MVHRSNMAADPARYSKEHVLSKATAELGLATVVWMLLSGDQIPSLRPISVRMLAVPGHVECVDPRCKRRGCPGNRTRILSTGAVRFKLVHYKTERHHKDTLRVTLPQQLSRVVRLYTELVRHRLVDKKEEDGAAGVLLLTITGRPFSESSLSQFFKKLQTDYGAPWPGAARPYLDFRHGFCSESFSQVLEQVRNAAPGIVGPRAAPMGHTHRTHVNVYARGALSQQHKLAIEQAAARRFQHLGVAGQGDLAEEGEEEEDAEEEDAEEEEEEERGGGWREGRRGGLGAGGGQHGWENGRPGEGAAGHGQAQEERLEENEKRGEEEEDEDEERLEWGSNRSSSEGEDWGGSEGDPSWEEEEAESTEESEEGSSGSGNESQGSESSEEASSSSSSSSSGSGSGSGGSSGTTSSGRGTRPLVCQWLWAVQGLLGSPQLNPASVSLAVRRHQPTSVRGREET